MDKRGEAIPCQNNYSNAIAASRRIVLVTGANGLVGMAVREHVSRNNLEAPGRSWFFAGSKDADLRELHATRSLFERVKPTHVLHLAAHVGGLFANMTHHVEFWRDNMAMQDSIFECCKEFKVERLVSCLSTCIFPDGAPLPMDESDIMNGPPHFSNRGYAYAKRMVMILGDLYNEQYGTNFATVVPCNVLGKHDNFSIEDGHVLPGLMHKCYLAKQNNEPFVIWGSGKPLRQFIYSNDLADLMRWYLLVRDETDPLILATDPKDEVSIEEAARMVASAMEFQGSIDFDGTKADGQYQKTCSNAKLRRMRPSLAFTPTRVAIAETASLHVLGLHMSLLLLARASALDDPWTLPFRGFRDPSEGKGPASSGTGGLGIPQLTIPRGRRDIHTFVLTECVNYQDWQTIAAAFAWRESGQPGNVTRVVNCPPDKTDAYGKIITEVMPTFRARQYIDNAKI